jgi:hypothetical protein
MHLSVSIFFMSPTWSAQSNLLEACSVDTLYVNGLEPMGATTITQKTKSICQIISYAYVH